MQRLRAQILEPVAHCLGSLKTDMLKNFFPLVPRAHWLVIPRINGIQGFPGGREDP